MEQQSGIHSDGGESITFFSNTLVFTASGYSNLSSTKIPFVNDSNRHSSGFGVLFNSPDAFQCPVWICSQWNSCMPRSLPVNLHLGLAGLLLYDGSDFYKAAVLQHNLRRSSTWNEATISRFFKVFTDSPSQDTLNLTQSKDTFFSLSVVFHVKTSDFYCVMADGIILEKERTETAVSQLFTAAYKSQQNHKKALSDAQSKLSHYEDALTKAVYDLELSFLNSSEHYGGDMKSSCILLYKAMLLINSKKRKCKELNDLLSEAKKPSNQARIRNEYTEIPLVAPSIAIEAGTASLPATSHARSDLTLKDSSAYLTASGKFLEDNPALQISCSNQKLMLSSTAKELFVKEPGGLRDSSDSNNLLGRTLRPVRLPCHPKDTETVVSVPPEATVTDVRETSSTTHTADEFLSTLFLDDA